jgi:hypothetical protein
MSANLDLVRSIYADWERGDFRSGEWADPEIEFSVVDGAVGMSGPGETAQFIRDIWSVWDDYRVMEDEFRELDDERVLVLVHIAGVGRTSGVDIGRVHKGGANLFHLRNGKVTPFALYWDRDRALPDLGLAPEDDAAS